MSTIDIGGVKVSYTSLQALGKAVEQELVKTDGKSPQWGNLAVKRYPKSIQGDVYVLVHRPPERLPG